MHLHQVNILLSLLKENNNILALENTINIRSLFCQIVDDKYYLKKCIRLLIELIVNSSFKFSSNYTCKEIPLI